MNFNYRCQMLFHTNVHGPHIQREENGVI